MSDKLKEMIEKLKRGSIPKEEAKPKPIETPAEEIEEVPMPQKAIAVKEEPKPTEAEAQQINEENQEMMISRRIMELQNEGIFRLEVLGEMRQIADSLNLLNEIITKAAGLDKKED